MPKLSVVCCHGCQVCTKNTTQLLRGGRDQFNLWTKNNSVEVAPFRRNNCRLGNPVCCQNETNAPSRFDHRCKFKHVVLWKYPQKSFKSNCVLSYWPEAIKWVHAFNASCFQISPVAFGCTLILMIRCWSFLKMHPNFYEIPIKYYNAPHFPITWVARFCPWTECAPWPSSSKLRY